MHHEGYWIPLRGWDTWPFPRVFFNNLHIHSLYLLNLRYTIYLLHGIFAIECKANRHQLSITGSTHHTKLPTTSLPIDTILDTAPKVRYPSTSNSNRVPKAKLTKEKCEILILSNQWMNNKSNDLLNSVPAASRKLLPLCRPWNMSNGSRTYTAS